MASFESFDDLSSGLATCTKYFIEATDGNGTTEQTAEDGSVGGSVVVVPQLPQTICHLTNPTPASKCQEVAEQQRTTRVLRTCRNGHTPPYCLLEENMQPCCL